MVEPSLELRSVTKRYGPLVAVDSVSVSVPSASIFGLLGPNGAGKTTCLRMIMDIIAPDEGEVFFQGRPRQAEDLSRIGYLPEERGLYRKMTVTEHLLLLGELHGLARSEARRRLDDWLQWIDLADRARSRVEELSKGMQQKVQILGTVLHEPQLLILDEPFSGLDPINQNLFKELLVQYRDSGRTVIFSTHVMEQAEKLCDQICLVSKGRIVLQGALDQIKRERGGNDYLLRAAGDLDRVRLVPGVEKTTISSDQVRLRLEAEAQASAVLAELVQVLQVREFRSEQPDLEQIFIEAVRDAAD